MKVWHIDVILLKIKGIIIKCWIIITSCNIYTSWFKMFWIQKIFWIKLHLLDTSSYDFFPNCNYYLSLVVLWFVFLLFNGAIILFRVFELIVQRNSSAHEVIVLKTIFYAWKDLPCSFVNLCIELLAIRHTYRVMTNWPQDYI